MKEYTTHCVRVNVVDGQHPNWPSNPIQDWTDKGWRIVTATIGFHGREQHPWESSLYVLMERDSPTPQVTDP